MLEQNSYIKSSSARASLLEDNKLFNNLYKLYIFHIRVLKNNYTAYKPTNLMEVIPLRDNIYIYIYIYILL